MICFSWGQIDVGIAINPLTPDRHQTQSSWSSLQMSAVAIQGCVIYQTGCVYIDLCRCQTAVSHAFHDPKQSAFLTLELTHPDKFVGAIRVTQHVWCAFDS